MATPITLRVLEGHLRSYRHTWRGTTISALLTPVLFLAAMGLGLGTLVDTGPARALGEVGYLAWLAPGLLAASAMQNGAADGAFPVVAGIRWIRTYHAALHTPVRPRDLMLGNLLWAAMRISVAGVAFTAIAAVFGAMPLGRGVLALVPAVLLGVGTCAAASAYSATLDTDQGLTVLFRFVVVPMFLFSGAFFPVSELPTTVQPVALALPVWHGVELARAAALGTGPALAWWVHLTVLVAFLAVGVLVGMRAFDRRLRR